MILKILVMLLPLPTLMRSAKLSLMSIMMLITILFGTEMPTDGQLDSTSILILVQTEIQLTSITTPSPRTTTSNFVTLAMWSIRVRIMSATSFIVATTDTSELGVARKHGRYQTMLMYM